MQCKGLIFCFSEYTDFSDFADFSDCHTEARTQWAPSAALKGYSALDHSAIDADTNASRNLIYELLWKENWCQQRVSKNKNQGRIRTRDRYLNLKNLIPMYSAFDHSAIVTDENYNRNWIHILLIVEYWYKQRLNSIESEPGFEPGIVISTWKILTLSTTP